MANKNSGKENFTFKKERKKKGIEKNELLQNTTF